MQAISSESGDIGVEPEVLYWGSSSCLLFIITAPPVRFKCGGACALLAVIASICTIHVSEGLLSGGQAVGGVFGPIPRSGRG